MQLATFPKFGLINAPTPLQRARGLERALGIDHTRIYLKRDDLTGLAFGGNKSRKLEYLVGEAIARDASVLVTEGAVQSNHARQTAAAAAIAGLRCILVLDARQGDQLQGNLLLDQVMGAEVRICPTWESRKSAMATIESELVSEGEKPFVIPTGGSTPLGAQGYVEFALELQSQLLQIGESPGRLYFPTGSHGTHAGLAVGARAVSATWQPWAIAVESSTSELMPDAIKLANATAELSGVSFTFSADNMHIDDRFAGEDYGVPTEAGMQAITLLAGTEAVFLDPVYSGKAMSGLIADLRSGHLRDLESVVFLHTGGGPSLFAFADEFATHLNAGALSM